jgi:succinate dehydrogenase/fumarate reductase flavoprotein subunit
LFLFHCSSKAHALDVQAGALGTKGGPRVDPWARVQHVEGGPIAGLYAAGNAMASPFDAGYPGAGSTLAQAITFGYLAGRAATGQF